MFSYESIPEPPKGIEPLSLEYKTKIIAIILERQGHQYSTSVSGESNQAKDVLRKTLSIFLAENNGHFIPDI